MKKALCMFIACLILLTASGCGSDTDTNTVTTAAATAKAAVDVDLTTLSSTMVYSEVYNMMQAPEKYVGKTVKMKGSFDVYEDANTKKRYFSCIIADATACCSQGLEFELKGSHSYPNDYPAKGASITVTGVFELYKEGDKTYSRLKNADMSV